MWGCPPVYCSSPFDVALNLFTQEFLFYFQIKDVKFLSFSDLFFKKDIKISMGLPH